MVSLNLFLIGAGCLVCLMPLALYFLFLAFLNQRAHPTILSGPWDYTCVLLGLSGFLLLGGPVLLATFDSNWRSYWFSGNFNRVQEVWHTNGMIWSTLALCYLLLLGGVIGIFMNLRRKVTVIYNLEASDLEERLFAVTESLSFDCRRVLGGFEIASRSSRRGILAGDSSKEPEQESEKTRSPREISRRGEIAFVQIQTFSFLHHATLRWQDSHSLLRQQIENELVKSFLTVESPANPAGGWFMTASVVLFCIMIAWMAFLIYSVVTFRPV